MENNFTKLILMCRFKPTSAIYSKITCGLKVKERKVLLSKLPLKKYKFYVAMCSRKKEEFS
jgi:hypothetical protein